MILIKKEKTQIIAAEKSGMDPKTARKYIRSKKLPSQLKEPRIWRTREDHFKGVPKRHRTDRMSAAVHKECNPEEFTSRYRVLLSHYGLQGEKIRTGETHENGNVEQSHKGIKHALDQSLMLRGSQLTF